MSWRSLAGQIVARVTVTALEPAETLSIGRADFERLRSTYSSVDRVLLAALATEVRSLSSLVQEMLYVPAETRVLRRLLAVAELWGGASRGLVLPLTQEDLAALAGTTRPTANRTLRQAELAGLLKLGRGRIELVDPVGLGRELKGPEQTSVSATSLAVFAPTQTPGL